MRLRSLVLLGLVATLLMTACKKDDDEPAAPGGGGGDTGPRLIMKFKFDSTQVRLNNIGLPAAVPAGHGAQSPVFNRMSAHYVEFAPVALTQLGNGEVVYRAPETTLGGALAIDHDLCLEVGQGGEFLNIPLSELTPGTYEWLRVSLSYQNYDIKFGALGTIYHGTVASFLGFNTYITTYQVHDSTIVVNDDKLQGYWAFEVLDPPIPVPVTIGQAPVTTVVNPMTGSPIPPGSCVVTAGFPTALTVTGSETEDVVIQVALSTNKSFEWAETDGDNLYEPIDGELVQDMGIRGMIPTRLQ